MNSWLEASTKLFAVLPDSDETQKGSAVAIATNCRRGNETEEGPAWLVSLISSEVKLEKSVGGMVKMKYMQGMKES